MRTVIGTLLFTSLLTAGSDAGAGVLRAGAARIDITPAKDAALAMSGYGGRTEGHTAIHDNLYARAVVADDGAAQAAIVTCDLIGLSHALWERISQRINRESGIPVENILLAGVHTHGAPTLAGPGGADPKRAAYTAIVENGVLEAVREARANLQPARVGAGLGQANVNINRRARTADGRWWLGFNPDGPSDKTLAVVKFETLAGQPIAIFSNYAVHGVVMGPKNLEITGDLPGATARFVERHFGGQVVAPWTSGAAGDQNPIYGPGTDFSQVAVLGQILGEEVLRVAADIRSSPRARIRGAQRVVSCPGQKLPPGARPRTEYVFEDAAPVDIRLSLLMIGDIALAGVSGEVLTMIGQRLKQQSPFTKTIMVTHCNGSSGYLPDDAAYAQVSYEIVTARVKKGCAENAIVGGLLELMAQVQ
jgi:hypothetical protein